MNFEMYLPPPLRGLNWRQHPLDGKLQLFERDTGLNVLLEGEETAHFQRIAPRTLLIAVTNACNLTCSFCYRDLESRSLWRYDSLMQFCRDADAWGVLEIAAGGGDPTLFPRWSEFIHELYDTTNLCLNFTTNGLLLTGGFLRDVRGKIGQIRLSLYEDNQYAGTIQRLGDHGIRFGVNWLITPADLDGMEAKFFDLLKLGVRDFLLLGYKGHDPALHLRPAHLARLSNFLKQVQDTAAIKLDSCWGHALPDLPRLFETSDCGAGDDFLSITSDKKVKPCSFHADGIPFDSLIDVRRIWENQRRRKHAALIGGCARLPERGLEKIIPLDSLLEPHL